MAKKVKTILKLQIPAGKANPAPPIGSSLGQHGVNIQEFCNQFNTKTKDKGNDIIPVIITIYEDRSFTFITKTPLASELIKKAIKLDKGSGQPNKEKVGTISKSQIKEIAKIKLPDLNTNDIDQAVNIVTGTAKSMGLKITD